MTMSPSRLRLVGAIDTHPPPTFDSIVPRLVAFDDRLLSYTTNQELSPHMAFASMRTNYSFRGNRGRGGGRGRSYSTRGRGFTQQISSSEGDTRQACQICGKPNHSALKCYHWFNNSYHDEELPQALAAMRITDGTDDASSEWYPDSGATSYLTNSTRHLQHSQPYHGNDDVMIDDGSYLPITHTRFTCSTSRSSNDY